MFVIIHLSDVHVFVYLSCSLLSLSLLYRLVGSLVSLFVLSVRGNPLIHFHLIDISSHSLIILYLAGVRP